MITNHKNRKKLKIMTHKVKEELLYTWNLTGKLHHALDQKVVDCIGKYSEEFLQLLESYQSAVIGVGETIENCMKNEESRELIIQLEQYCEEIYQLSQSLDTLQNYYIKSANLLNKHQDILESFKEILVKKTALFLPYKFSMWDSLESIYFAVKEDSDWEAVVMPIPYIEQEEGKTTEEWKYEGAYFQQIPIVSYQEYIISEQQPDIIYIHNPYDDYNLVTSVAPQYYSAELKKYCKKLVYVPYFFTGRMFPEIHLATPSYANMDYIILPSQDSVEQMEKYVPREKLLALGSPKIDRMLRMSQLKQMPEEWRNRIRGRKTVLYNVSINAILNGGFQVILKMRYVFNYFKRQNKLVLWWRPHPLMKSTLKSMRPELLGAYEAMEEAFLREQIGIYDTTPDSNLAVAATDAFLGSYSSMCALYGIMGKPIFLAGGLPTEEPTKEEKRILWPAFPGAEPYIRELRTYPVKDAEGNMYFYAKAYKVFCKISRDFEKIDVIQKFEDDWLRLQAFHTKEPKQMEIYFYPQDKTKPGKIYHVADNTWTELNTFIDIPLSRHIGITKYKNQWVVLPGKDPEFIFINEETGERNQCCGYDEVLRPYCQMPEEILLCGFMQLGNYCYLLSYRINKLLEFNLEDKSWRYYDIGVEEDRFSTFWFDDVDFWFLAWDGSHVVRWNKETGKLRVYSDMPREFLGLFSNLATPYTPAFSGAFDIRNGEVILFPNVANMHLKLNKETGKIVPWELQLPYEEGQRKSSLYNMTNNYGMRLWYDENHLCTQTAYDGSLLLIDLNTGETERKQCLLSEEDYEKYHVPMDKMARRDNNFNSPYYHYEDGFQCTLKDMMDYFALGANMQEERQHLASTEGIENADGSCGKKIHEYMKDAFMNI